METPKRLVEFFKLFTKPKEVINVTQLPSRKTIRFLTRTILLFEEERKWYLEHDNIDLEYIDYLDRQITKLINRRNDMYNIYLHQIVKFKTDNDIKLRV